MGPNIRIRKRLSHVLASNMVDFAAWSLVIRCPREHAEFWSAEANGLGFGLTGRG